jgi:hypothetical protein
MDLKNLKEKINKKLIPSSYNSVIKTPFSIFEKFFVRFNFWNCIRNAKVDKKI